MLLIAGCGGADEETQRAAEVAQAEEERVAHVHGLGVDPGDRSLYIATHTGLFRAAAGSNRAQRVGDSYQDTMGFTVVGPRRFLGSGHPDARTGEPPLLGLIESTDAGKSWRPVALSGEADFHVLRTSGSTVYGFDATTRRLLVRAGGRWSELRFPGAAVVDLVTHPSDPDELVLMSDRGLYRSSNFGRRWQRLAASGPGLILRDSRGRLILLRDDGSVERSSNGRRWRVVGHVDGQPAAAVADGDELYVALHDIGVMQSSDGGRSWRVRVGL